MSRLEDFDNAFWDDPEVEDLSAFPTLLYIWSWTNRRCGMAGLYKVSLRGMTESKVPADVIPDALGDLAAAEFAYYVDGVMWVRTRVQRLRTKSGTMARAIAKDVERIRPDHPLRVRFLNYYVDLAWLRDYLPKAPTGPTDGLSENTVSEPNLDSPSGTPTGVPRLGLGQGHRKESSETTVARTREAVDQTQPPDTLPAELVDRVQPVLDVLTRVHALRGGNVPTVRGVGLALGAFPQRDHLRVVGELEHWSTAGNGARRPQKDWVRLYRTFLERSPEASPQQTNASVTPLSERDARRKRNADALASLMGGEAA